MAKNNQSRRHPQAERAEVRAEQAEQSEVRAEQDQPGTPHAEHEHGPDSHAGWATEQAQERSRQRAMAAREKATRTQMPVGQSGVMRLKKGNQPRGGR